MIHDVALSFAGKEADRLEAVKPRLERAGLEVWADSLLPAGGFHEPEILAAIECSATFVYLDSPRWRISSNCRKEVEHARRCGKRIIAVGESPAEDGAAVRVPEDDQRALVEAIRDGLDVCRAHVRLRIASTGKGGSRRKSGARAIGLPDIETLERADLAGLGISLDPRERAWMEAARRRALRRRRARTLAIAGVFAAAIALATISVEAWRSARGDEREAVATAQHVESLNLAAASEEAADTATRVRWAMRASRLDPNQMSTEALRTALADLSRETVVTGLRSEPATAVAVADDGSAAAVAYSSGALSLVSAGLATEIRDLPSERIDADAVLALTPDAKKLAVVSGENRAVAIVDVDSGRIARVAGLADVAGLVALAKERLVAVDRAGAVFEIDPRTDAPEAARVGAVRGPVRAATLAHSGPGESFGLATLAPGAVEVTEIGGGPGPSWRVPLPVEQEAYAPGAEALRACGDQLAILTTDRPNDVRPVFDVAYTVSRGGKARATGSALSSAGIVCLPEGGALASDHPRGEFSIPPATPHLVGFTGPPGNGALFAVASSQGGRWAAAAGSDGTLRLARLEAFARSREIPSLRGFAPADPLPLMIAGDRIEAVPANGAPQSLAAPRVSGEFARGAYFDPQLGTVLAVGKQLLLVEDGVVRAREEIPGGIEAVSPGAPGASAVVLAAGGSKVVIVPLRGEDQRMVLDANSFRGAARWLDIRWVPGSSNLAVAGEDGNVSLIAIEGGDRLRSREVTESGRIVLAAGDGWLAAGGADGTVRLLDPQTLAPLATRQAAVGGVEELTVAPGGDRIAVRSIGGEVAVFDLPGLHEIARVGPVEALGAAVFTADGGDLLLASYLRYIGGGGEGHLVSWPLCDLCDGELAELRSAILDRSWLAGKDRLPRFVPPARRAAGSPSAAAGPTPVVTPQGIGRLRLGATADDLQRLDLIEGLRPGCEFDAGRRAADLRSPLSGLAVFSHPNTRLSTIYIEGGADSAEGIGVGDDLKAALDAYPEARYTPPDPGAPFPSGLVELIRGGEVALTFAIDPETLRVAQIGIPSIPTCD